MRDGVDGLMVDRANDHEGFAAALARLLDEPLLARRMGAAGRRRALSTFSWPVVADQLEELYAQALGRDRPRSSVPLAA